MAEPARLDAVLGEAMTAWAGGARHTVSLPAGLPLLNANDRPHWAGRAALTDAIREAAGWQARAQRIPKLGRCVIVVEYQPPDRRVRDAGNLAPSGKAAIDGLRDAGVIADDHAGLVPLECYMIGLPCPRGRLVLYLTEVHG